VNPLSLIAGAPLPLPSGPGPAKTHLLQELKHTSPPLGCRFDPTGRFVFAGTQDNTIQRWELATGKQTALVGHKSWVRALGGVPGANLLISGDYAGRLIWWQTDAETPAPLRTVQAHRGWIRALAVSPDGQTLATCGNDHLVKLWSVADGKPLREVAGHACHVYNVAFHPNGKELVSGDLRGVVKHWDLARGTTVRELDAKVLHKYDNVFQAEHGGVRSMTFNSDGSLLACAGITDVLNAFAGVGKPLVVLFDWQTGKPKQQLRPRQDFRGTAWGVGFHPAGFLASVGAGNGGMLWFWKPDQAQDFFSLKLPSEGRDLHFHPDGLRLAIPTFDGAVRIWSMTAKA
jgi:WD40 repeat protein